MDIKDPNKSYKVTQHQLEKLPKSKYRPDNYLEQLLSTKDNAAPASTDVHSDSDATLLYSSSDKTIQYWPPDDDYTRSTSVTPSKTDTTSTMKDTTGQRKIVSKSKFNINLHGIRKYCRRYYFKCAVVNCNKTFSKILDWNTHHCLFHKSRLKCETCGAKFITPSAHRAHKNYHAPCKYTCSLCDKTFASIVG